jgi:3-(3-hydroxy-phenyl)propionate hydroxylase
MHGELRPPDLDVDVVVVGRGPVGATLANLLGLCGIRTLVLEREAKAYHLPRAVHFDDESMRVFQTIGLAEAIQPHVILSPGMRFVDAEGRLVLDWSRPATLTPMGWHLSYRFHQPDLETVLNQGLERWPSVEVKNRCEVFALTPERSAVRVHYEDLSTGRLVELQAGFVVGCDGARSLVRRLIGSPLDDLGFHERWLVVDVLLNRPRPDLGDYSIQHCDPQRPATYIRGTGTRRRWEISIHPHEDAHDVAQPDRVRELLARWLAPGDAEIERAAVYTFHSAIAERWRRERLLLAGDSAHQTPPFLGQGMCAGIRDAANLAWKLQRVLQGADAALLDTYQSERAPHVREFIELAIRLGGLINTKAMAAGLAAAEARDNEPAKLEVRKPRLGPGLTAGDDALTGQLAPQFMLRDGRRSDDLVGYRHALLLQDDAATALSSRDRAALMEAQVTVLTPAEAEGLDAWLDGHDIAAALVRPDRYVQGVSRRGTPTATLIASLLSVPRHDSFATSART